MGSWVRLDLQCSTLNREQLEVGTGGRGKPDPGLQFGPPMKVVTHCSFLAAAPGNSMVPEVLGQRGWRSLEQ